MDADDSIELGPTAPALELPWQDTEGRLHYVDLRTEPDSIELVPEAQQFPALRRFLIDLNSQDGPWQTVKCDVWSETIEASENLYGASYALSGYVDIVLAESQAALRGSREAHQRVAREIVQLLEENATLEATAEIVVRRCYFHRDFNRSPDRNTDRSPDSSPDSSPEQDESDAGYCLTQFLTGYGTSATEAAGCWEHAIEFAAKCWLRVRPY
jgi:hypothetical protein